MICGRVSQQRHTTAPHSHRHTTTLTHCRHATCCAPVHVMSLFSFFLAGEGFKKDEVTRITSLQDEEYFPPRSSRRKLDSSQTSAKTALRSHLCFPAPKAGTCAGRAGACTCGVLPDESRHSPREEHLERSTTPWTRQWDMIPRCRTDLCRSTLLSRTSPPGNTNTTVIKTVTSNI